jgi:hypothetical protein
MVVPTPGVVEDEGAVFAESELEFAVSVGEALAPPW